MKKLLIALAFALSACTVLTNVSTPGTSPGVVSYYLPKTMVHLTVKGKRTITTMKTLNATGQTTYSNGLIATKVASTKHSISDISIKSVTVADPVHQYAFKHKNNVFSDDKIEVQLTANNLLKKISVESEDKSGDFVVKLGDLTSKIAQVVTVKSTDKTDRIVEEIDLVYDVIFDPTIPADIASVRAALSAMYPGAFTSINFTGVVPTTPARNLTEGIKYRPMIPLPLTIVSTDLTKAVLIPVPGATIYNLEVTRTAFTKKITSMEFDEGVLTSFNIEKKSEVAGFIDIPINLAKSIVSIPAELIQLKINNTGKNKELLEAQKGLEEAQDELRKYLRELAEQPDDQNPF